MNIDDRLSKLEQAFKPWPSAVIGTQLTRTLEEDGVGWCLALGGMNFPKEFFYGKTIEEVVSKAEDFLDKNKLNKEKLQKGDVMVSSAKCYVDNTVFELKSV